MLRKTLLIASLCLLAATTAWAKPPIYFSFASDDYHEGPTFRGDGGEISGEARVDLMVDQQSDFEGGVVIFPSTFKLTAKMHSYQVVPLGAGFLHIWEFEGEFAFNHYDVAFGFPLLLTTRFKYAVLTSQSPSNTQAGETMTLQASQSVDGNVSFKDGAGVEAVLNLIYPDDYIARGSDFAFTFTNVRAGGSVIGPPPNLSLGGKFTESWESEGSFSASGGEG